MKGVINLIQVMANHAYIFSKIELILARYSFDSTNFSPSEAHIAHFFYCLSRLEGMLSKNINLKIA